MPIKRFNSSEGALTVMWSLVLPLVIGFIGLGVEVSMWYGTKSDLQSVTDATAIATAYYINGATSLQNVAQHELERNINGGWQGKNVSIAVNNPPQSGIYTGNGNAVEILASEPQKLLFSGLFLPGGPVIRTRAVALSLPVDNGQGCFMASAGVQTDDLVTGGATSVNAPGCILVNNSLGSQATALNGGSVVTIRNVYTAGGIHIDGNSTLNNSNPNITGAAQVPDPFSTLDNPEIGSCNVHNFASRGSATLSPGVYCGGVDMEPQANVTLEPGTYIINGGSFKVGAQASMSGSGVTLVFANDASIAINGGVSVALSAPTDGPFAGILFYGLGDARSSTDRIVGGNTMDLSGILYLPARSVQYSGGLDNGSCTKIVASDITFVGASNITLNCPPGYRNIPVPTGSLVVKLKE